LPLSLAFLFLRLAWLGLGRKYKFTCLYSVIQVCISLWLIYQFPNAQTVGYTWAWTLSRWPIMALLICAVLEVCGHIGLRNSRGFKGLVLLVLPGAAATFGAVMLWQCLAVDWGSPYLVVRVFQVTCLVNSSVFFAVAFFLIAVRLFVARPQTLRPNVLTSWLFLTLYLSVESVMNFLMNVMNREENTNIGYVGTPLRVAVIVAWSMLLSNEGEAIERQSLEARLSTRKVREGVPGLRPFLWNWAKSCLASAQLIHTFFFSCLQNLRIRPHRLELD
jgi:hypothetical protein